ncbi:MAG: hypothetical protein AB7G28_13475 [Pirellulales bacterium]
MAILRFNVLFVRMQPPQRTQPKECKRRAAACQLKTLPPSGWMRDDQRGSLLTRAPRPVTGTVRRNLDNRTRDNLSVAENCGGGSRGHFRHIDCI